MEIYKTSALSYAQLNIALAAHKHCFSLAAVHFAPLCIFCICKDWPVIILVISYSFWNI